MLSAILKERQALHAIGQERAYNLAEMCALLGKKQDALSDLQSSYLKREGELLRLRTDPSLASLHDEPRFRELCTPSARKERTTWRRCAPCWGKNKTRISARLY